MKRSKLIGISGGSGVGKTSITNALLGQSTNSLIIPHDAYYKSYDEMTLEEKKQINYWHPETYDNELFLEHLEALKQGKQIDMPNYSFAEYRRLEDIHRVVPTENLFFDGFLLYATPEIVEQLDERIFIDLPEDERLRRIIYRDFMERGGRSEEFVRSQFARNTKPMHDKFIEPAKQHATLIIDGRQKIEDSAAEISDYLQSKGIYIQGAEKDL